MKAKSTHGPGSALDGLRDRLLDAALPHVPFDGWTRSAMLNAARDEGLPPADIDIAFPTGMRAVLAHWLARCDSDMAAAMRAEDLDAMKIRERVALGVRLRLQRAAPHKEAVRRALAFLALPGNGALAAKSLYRTVDSIWRICGDTATDFNFYSKRGLLAGVYTATLLYWLDDGSQDHGDSWAFLDRRIADVMRIPKLTGRLKDLGRLAPDPARFARAWRNARHNAA